MNYSQFRKSGKQCPFLVKACKSLQEALKETSPKDAVLPDQTIDMIWQMCIEFALVEIPSERLSERETMVPEDNLEEDSGVAESFSVISRRHPEKWCFRMYGCRLRCRWAATYQWPPQRNCRCHCKFHKRFPVPTPYGNDMSGDFEGGNEGEDFEGGDEGDEDDSDEEGMPGLEEAAPK